ncbi:MAG: tyrosine-protein phosphatase [Actinomycetota bacterium]
MIPSELDGLLPNLRDVGGLPAAGGRRVLHGRLYRSDGLQRLDPDQRASIVTGLGVRTLIDLRSELERGRTGEVDAPGGAVIHRVPILDGSYMQAAADGLTLVDMFDAIAFRETAALAEAVALLARPDAGPTLVFCTAGKDRTGVLVALVLDLLGVDRDAIAADFTASADGVARIIEAFLANFDDGELPDIPPDVLSAPPEVIVDLLEAVDERAGGARSLLTGAGLDPSAADRLASVLLEPRS